MWAPGAVEGVALWHTTPPPVDPAVVDRIHAALLAATARPTDETARSALRDAVAGVDVRNTIRAIGQELDASPPPEDAAFAGLLRDLVTRSGRREEVKLGLGLLGAFRDRADVEPIRVLARHDEFTVWATAALERIVEDPVAELRSIAPMVDGWGRVEVVHRLLLRGPQPDVCEYLVAEGHRNHVAEGYTALPVAAACGLDEMLAGEPSDVVLRGAGELLAALARDALDGGPDGTLLDWPDGKAAVLRLLERAERLDAVEDASHLADIARFATEADDGDERVVELGWDAATREDVRRRIAELLAPPGWAERISAAIASDDRTTRIAGMAAARRLGLPVGPRLDELIAAEPLDTYLWSQLLDDSSASVERALALVPLVLREPRDEDVTRIPLGPGFSRELIVSLILRRLATEPVPDATSTLPPGALDVVLDGLTSPRPGNRTQALDVVARWPRERWEPAVAAAVAALATDPYENIRTRAAAMTADS